MDQEYFEQQYINKGWVKIDLVNKIKKKKTILTLESALVKIKDNNEITLSNYHKFVNEDEAQNIRWKLTKIFWKEKYVEKICMDNIGIFKKILGPDLHIQSKPYLRIARPKIRTDNIGYHRDTYYGQSPYEVTFHIPLTDVTKSGSLKFVTQSHVKSEEYYKPQKETSLHKKGSKEHMMGFPYAPIKMEKKKFENDLKAVPLKVGQGILFSPSTIHGQEINNMLNTRFSFDLRLINSNAPVKFKKDLTPRGYKEINSSAIHQVYKLYNKANKKNEL